MIRRKAKRQEQGNGFPPWMITFSDMVTLLMTFFIVLVSMASMTDVYKRKVALGSVSGTFGTGASGLDDLTTLDSRTKVDPGPFNVFNDLAPLRERLWKNPEKDLRFESNRFMQRLSMDARALFAPGSADLTEQGRALLDRVLPVVAQSAYPMGLSGHAAGGMEEFGPDYLPKPWVKTDFSWELSLKRVVAVYRYFVDQGVDPAKLRVEAFGRYRPRSGDGSGAEGVSNRRVEITLDRRVGSWAPEAAADAVRQKEASKPRDSFSVKDFLFRFDMPGGR